MNFLKRLKKFKKKPIEAKSVGFSYQGQEVLRNINLSIKESQITAIIGKSGSGKSTFLKLTAGIISRSHEGKIKIFGKNKFFSKSKIGFVPQELSFIPDLSIKDNIEISGLMLGLSKKESIKKASELMKMLKLSEDINKLPTNLSGGQKVRLNIILSILHDPKILILDEPFVGLDFQNRRLLWHFLEKLRKKEKTIILTSHLLTETQEHVDNLVILQNHQVLFSGKLEKLKAKLKINYLYELRFSNLSKENLEKIKKFTNYKEIKIMDNYERYLMFGLSNEKQKNILLKFLEKLNLKFSEVSYREPNLDEIFLKNE